MKDTAKEAKWGFSLSHTLGTDRSQSAGEQRLSLPLSPTVRHIVRNFTADTVAVTLGLSCTAQQEVMDIESVVYAVCAACTPFYCTQYPGSDE